MEDTVLGGLRVMLAACLTLVLTSQAVFAQTNPPRVEVSGGYTFLTDGDIHFPTGVLVDVGVAVTDRFRIVTEVAHHRSTQNFVGFDVNLSETSALFGPRFVARGSGVTGFFQGLVGGAKVRSGVADSSEQLLSLVSFAAQFGGGLLIRLAQTRVGLRLGADFQVLTDDEFGETTQFRVNAGLSFGVGRR